MSSQSSCQLAKLNWRLVDGDLAGASVATGQDSQRACDAGNSRNSRPTHHIMAQQCWAPTGAFLTLDREGAAGRSAVG